MRQGGWGPRLRSRLGYYTPDDVYEATVVNLVSDDTQWLDVGGGRDLFPDNEPAATMLAHRCRFLAGVDPSDNIRENRFVHERVQSTIEDFSTDSRFDLITLRMVAEHLADPDAAVRSLARLTKPGGLVVIFTVDRWSVITALSAITPVSLHHRIKSWLWRTEERDTFEVAYRMNTRKDLRKLFESSGFAEREFAYLGDCRVFARWRLLNTIELRVWKMLTRAGLKYPESCLLGIYQKVSPA